MVWCKSRHSTRVPKIPLVREARSSKAKKVVPGATIKRIAMYGSQSGDNNPLKLQQAREFRQMIEYQAGPYGPMEADARRRWADMLGEIQKDPKLAAEMRSNRQQTIPAGAVAGAGGAAGGTPGAGPTIPAPPGGGSPI